MATDTERRGRHGAKGTVEPRRARRGLDPRRIAVGLASGFVATVVMTVFRMPISRSPPPTAYFWTKYVGGGEPDEHTLVGLALHLTYGTVGGGLFAALPAGPPTADEEVGREARSVLRGLVFGLLLYAFGTRVVLARLLDMDLAPHERFIFLLSHVVYGLALGARFGSKAE